METFGTLIARARKRCRLRLEDLAKKIHKPDGDSISVPYLSDLEHDRRNPSEPLIPQLSLALQLPEDLIYFSLGKIPPDLRECNASQEQIITAFRAFRSMLTATTTGADDAQPYHIHYERTQKLPFPADHLQYDAVRNGKSARLERRGFEEDTQPAA